MPVNDPHFHTGDRRTFDPAAMNTPQGFENFQTWMESTHSRLSPQASRSYSYGGSDQIDYYNGLGPEVAAAYAEINHGPRRKIQSPRTSDGTAAHGY